MQLEGLSLENFCSGLRAFVFRDGRLRPATIRAGQDGVPRSFDVGQRRFSERDAGQWTRVPRRKCKADCRSAGRSYRGRATTTAAIAVIASRASGFIVEGPRPGGSPGRAISASGYRQHAHQCRLDGLRRAHGWL